MKSESLELLDYLENPREAPCHDNHDLLEPRLVI